MYKNCTKYFILFQNGGEDMNDENNILENYQTTSSETDEKSIYFHINNLKTQKIEQTKENSQKKQSLYNTNKYLITTILAILIYILCAWTAQVTLPEIIDLEIPLVILFSLIITALSNQGYKKSCYVAFLVITIITYQFNPSYAFFVIMSLLANWIYECIELIYSNQDDYSKTGSLEIKFGIKDYFNRMKYHILLSVVLFITFTLLSYYYPAIFQSLITSAVDGLKDGVKDGSIKLETLPLFMNNLSVGLNMVLGGFYLSVTTVYLLVYNALIVGYTAALMNLGYFLSFTLPHGIIELSAIILAGAAGTRVTQGVLTLLSGIYLNKENKSDIFSEKVELALKMFFDSILLIIVITVLLLIAAFIEANLTLPIGQMLMGV